MSAENNPARYSEMSVTRTSDEADEVLLAFLKDVRAAREKHRIQDVHVICRVVVADHDSEAPAFASAHFGATQESEGMCGWAFARAAEDRRSFVDHMKAEGSRAAKKAKP